MKIIPYCFFLSLLFTVSIPAYSALNIHSKHCLYGCPSGYSLSSELIVRENYVLNFSKRTRLPDWVAFKLKRADIGDAHKINWTDDPLLAESVTLGFRDYFDAADKGLYEPGFLVPLENFSAADDWREVYYLSQAVPLKPALKSGAWLKLDEKIREILKRSMVAEVYVMAGAVYERSMPLLPGTDKAHQVPSAYWKIVSMYDPHGPKTAAFYFDQALSKDTDYCNHIVTVRGIERLTGLDFFHAVSPSKVEYLETGPSHIAGHLGCKGEHHD